MYGYASKRSGFTLVELMLVVVIVAILSINLIPRFASTDVFRSRTYGDEVLNSIRYAQKIAVGMGCEVQVSSSGANLVLNLRQGCTDTTNTAPFNVGIRDPLTGASAFNKLAPNNVSVTSSDLPIYFDSLGRARDSGSGNISSAQVSVGSRTFQIVGQTGFTYEP